MGCKWPASTQHALVTHSVAQLCLSSVTSHVHEQCHQWPPRRGWGWGVCLLYLLAGAFQDIRYSSAPLPAAAAAHCIRLHAQQTSMWAACTTVGRTYHAAHILVCCACTRATIHVRGLRSSCKLSLQLNGNGCPQPTCLAASLAAQQQRTPSCMYKNEIMHTSV
jgi:hypothetical protein